ncbi:MAG: 16S rRNA (cytosine(967)-C(5))-methyltransferase RsmB [Candidatus Hydrogenedentes bacterium]|nr:16S rRNA (cytosine(967)-C(5))-methyltransferase RsmB [Candidatus Hydrogenedentota bacterium]
MNIDPVRDAAIDVLLRVFERNVHLDESLDKTIRRKALSDRGRRFLTQLAYGTVRYRLLCDHVLKRLVRQPLDKLPPPILAILRMGVFQALYCRQVTFPAMVHTSVDLAKKRGHAGTAKLANAVLKRVPQHLEDVALPDSDTDPAAPLSVGHSMPLWLVTRWLREYGRDGAAALCEASNIQAPLTIRANTLKTGVEELSAGLEKAGCPCAKETSVPEELTVLEGPLLRTKLFQHGHFMIQDPASMLPAHLMEPKAGERILDLCAAPGGKTTHMAALARGEATIIAADARRNRLFSVADNMARLETPGVHLLCADAAHPPFRGGFSGVLLDAPCSGLGTLRRHPDLKWRMREQDIARLAGIQRELLRSAVQLCENGGRIVYSVCTFTQEETEEVAQFAETLNGINLEDGPEWLNRWRVRKGLYRTLPNGDRMDGFFLMRLRKSS